MNNTPTLQPDDELDVNKTPHSVDKSQGDVNGFNMEEIALCKGCNTMKHLNAEGYCGRCIKGEDTVHE